LIPLYLAVLHAAALLVPAGGRREWLAEWCAELHYVARHSRRGRTAAFCLGALRDALWLRRHDEDFRPQALLDSPFRCLGLLAIAAALCAIGAFRLPEARKLLPPVPYPDAGRLVLVSRGGQRVSEVPTMSPAAYRLLADHRQGRFSNVAFYRHLETRSGPDVAAASGNLFRLLGVPPASSGTVILSERGWRKYFHRDPHIVGRTVRLAGETGVVAGVLPADDWRLPGQFDAWLLDDDRAMAGGTGFAVARLEDPRPGSWRMSPSILPLLVPDGAGGTIRYECICPAFAELPVMGHVWMLAISLLVASTGTSFLLGEYGGGHRARRWIFFAAKFALLIVIVVCGSLDFGAIVSEALVPHSLLVGYVLAIRWALVDQRQRCPVCLRVLTSPTRIGGASHAFLAWYGTELICGRGHGLLHVPEIRTSSYWTQRWMSLDESWRGVISGSPR
jgi:hypothetical protein